MCCLGVSPRPSFVTPALPGPGSEIRRMMGWTQVGKTERSWLWWFRGALRRRGIFLSFAQQLTGEGKDRTTQHGRSSPLPRVLVYMRMDTLQLSGHKLLSAVGHCLSNSGGLSHP